MEYICRKDNMCKVRGFRVDLLGVEVVMLSYPGITEACVTYFTDSGGTNILFGYFIVDHDVDHETLRTHLGEHLPYYAIPVGLIQVNDFPRTLSGKVNRSGFVPPKELDDYKKLAIQYF